MTRRRLPLLLVLSIALVPGVANPLAVRAASVELTADCDTPTARDGCSRWYTAQSVFLSWQHEPGGGLPITGCSSEFLTAETQRIERSCTWSWPPDLTATTTVWIGIDRTPPRVLAPQPSRPPDQGDWYNHPVGLTFQGADDISGVASCTSTTYGGPDGAGSSVAGSCTDVAGNVGSASFPLNYDATPPQKPDVTAAPGNGRVSLQWSAAPDVGLTEVVRYGKTIAPVVVFRGFANAYTDGPLPNEKRSSYAVTVYDQAGNSATSHVSSVPTASMLLSPALGARVRAAPLLMWKPLSRATYYNVQLVRNGKQLSQWPREPRLQLRSRWHFAGKWRRLTPGVYTWYVWPGYGRLSEKRYGRLLGRSKFRVLQDPGRASRDGSPRIEPIPG